MPALFTPLAIRGVTFKNRVMLSPMAQFAAREGCVTDWHYAHLGKFAIGGVGFACLEAARVERRGLGTVGDLGLWQEEQVAPLAKLVAYLRSLGTVTGIQLGHAGRKAGTRRPTEGAGPLDRSVPVEGQAHWPAIAPSAVAFRDGWPVPQAMGEREIGEVIEAFAQAARRAHAAGIDVIEVPGAHGDLIHQFLSPAANRRTDGYGGSLENRMRFALEIAVAVRRHWPETKPLFFRISAQDEGGWSLEDSVILARELKARGVDAIDCTSGGIDVGVAAMLAAEGRPGFQVPYAQRIRHEAAIATVAVGLITKPEQANEIIEQGQADLVAIGREMLWNPFWAVQAAKTLGADPEYKGMPQQYGWWLERRVKTGYEQEL
jgi:2,4-dienoyl-CoA reductase-like NADH-dependent reductase (Old Yellow Enzyme family)